MKDTKENNRSSKIPKFLRSKKNLVIVAMLLAIMLIGSIINLLSYESTDNAYVEANITTIGAEVSGAITQVYCLDHQQVKKNDVLAEIDKRDYILGLHQANAVLEQAVLNIKVADQKDILAKLALQNAKHAFQLAEVNRLVAERELNRVSKLAKDNFSTQQLLDNAKAKFENAQFQYDKAKIDIELAEEGVKLVGFEKNIALAKLDESQQAVALAQKQFDSTDIKAPIDGTVANSFLRIGNFAVKGGPLLSLVPHDMYIAANFKETQVSEIKPEMAVIIKLDGVKGKIRGKVRNNSPATGSVFSLIPTDNATGNFTKVVQRVPVFIDFVAPEDVKGLIVPGMSASVKVKF
jgi:membrane fusion protein (multidrug efflux system)